MFTGIKLILMSTMSIDIVTLTHFLTGCKPRRVFTSRGSGLLNTAAPHRHYIQEFRDVATALRARMSLADYKKNYE